ncbi:hypothetical protein VTN96DRAFT_8704 [Rasamsonia emersonii]
MGVEESNNWQPCAGPPTDRPVVSGQWTLAGCEPCHTGTSHKPPPGLITVPPRSDVDRNPHSLTCCFLQGFTAALAANPNPLPSFFTTI